MQEIVEYQGHTCYIPISGMCFLKCNSFFAEKVYTEEVLTFVRTEQRRSNVMTSARIQPFCRKCNINIGCFQGTRINPRNFSQKNTSLFIQNNHFCLIWKSDVLSFFTALKN